MQFKIGNSDFSAELTSLKVEYVTFVSDLSGRNAQGDNFIYVVNQVPKKKIYCGFGFMPQTRLNAFLAAIRPFIVTVTYWDPYEQGPSVIKTNIGTPAVELLELNNGETFGKPFSLNFIQM